MYRLLIMPVALSAGLLAIALSHTHDRFARSQTVSGATPPATWTPRPTWTPFPTLTPRPTLTPFPTLTPRPTWTPFPTLTPRPTRTPFPTLTPRPTRTPYTTITPRPTLTPPPTWTPRSTVTPIAYWTPSPHDARGGSLDYPGPSIGLRGAHAVAYADMRGSCLQQISSVGIRVNGRVIRPVGFMIGNASYCPSFLFIMSPGPGRLHGLVAIPSITASPGALSPATPLALVVTVLRQTGSVDDAPMVITASVGGAPTPFDIDVSHATAVAFIGEAPGNASTGNIMAVYNLKLSGSATIVRPVVLASTPLPPGAIPLPLSDAYLFRTAVTTQPIAVTDIELPAGTAVRVPPYSHVTIAVPPHSSGTLVLRYGAESRVIGSASQPSELRVAVYDSQGTLLRAAVGWARVGDGLHRLWVPVGGGDLVDVSVPVITAQYGGHYSLFNGPAVLVVTDVGLVRRPVPPYRVPDRVITVRSPRPGQVLDLTMLRPRCLARPGLQPTIVRHQILPAGEYIDLGSSSGLFCQLPMPGPDSFNLSFGPHTQGAFHAMFALQDTAPPGSAPVVQVAVYDRGGQQLASVRRIATFGSSGTPIDVPLDSAAMMVVTAYGSDAVLYDVRLSGSLSVYTEESPPSDPPLAAARGMPVDPATFFPDCPSSAIQLGLPMLAVYGSPGSDIVLPRGVIPAQRAIIPGSNFLFNGQILKLGMSTLCPDTLRLPKKLHYHRFGALLSFGAAALPSDSVRITMKVLDASHKALHSATWTMHGGADPQVAFIDLSGGAFVQFSFDALEHNMLTTTSLPYVYALTLT